MGAIERRIDGLVGFGIVVGLFLGLPAGTALAAVAWRSADRKR